MITNYVKLKSLLWDLNHESADQVKHANDYTKVSTVRDVEKLTIDISHAWLAPVEFS